MAKQANDTTSEPRTEEHVSDLPPIYAATGMRGFA